MTISWELAHLRIVADIEREIIAGHINQGEQLAPEDKLAAHYQASRRVVRNAMSELERRNVISRQRGKGTFIKQCPAPAQKKEFVAGVILNKVLCVNNMTRLAGIANVFLQQGVPFHVHDSAQSLDSEIRGVGELSQKCDGVILLSVAVEKDIDHLKRIRDRHYDNIVLLDRFFHDVAFDSVCCDHFDGTYKAAWHLHSRGYGKIAYVGSAHDVFSVHERIMGFTKAAQAFNPQSAPVIMRKGVEMHRAGYEAAEELVKQGKADALVCENDDLALGVLEFLKIAGIKPGKEFGVVGFDDLDGIMRAGLGLSSIEANCYETGRKAAQMLVDKMAGAQRGGDVQKIVLPVTLIERESTKRD